MDAELDKIVEERFKHFSNARLVERINRRYKAELNDDDEVRELFRRSRTQGFKVIVGRDTYSLPEGST